MFIKAKNIFTGDSWLTDHAVQVTGGRVGDIIPVSQLSPEMTILDLGNQRLVSSFIDLQIYGAHEKLFALYPDSDALTKLKEYCRAGGAAFCMPTVATNRYEVFFRCIHAIRKYWQEGGKGILGLHIEGPWINPVKRGAHNESLIHAPTLKKTKELLDYGKDVIRIITLAPEVCDPEIIDIILSAGIIVSAGHSNARFEEAVESFDRGIRTVTHLFNAMSPLQHRAPGLVGATMASDHVMASIIPDGYHVDFPVIQIAKSVLKDRLFVITDAVTESTDGYYQHQLVGDRYEAGGILSGSALNMARALKNLITEARIPLDEALRMCSLYPARVIRMEKELGRIQKGFRAVFTVLDESLQVTEVLEY